MRLTGPNGIAVSHRQRLKILSFLLCLPISTVCAAELTISAAASLGEAFTEIAERLCTRPQPTHKQFPPA